MNDDGIPSQETSCKSKIPFGQKCTNTPDLLNIVAQPSPFLPSAHRLCTVVWSEKLKWSHKLGAVGIRARHLCADLRGRPEDREEHRTAFSKDMESAVCTEIE